MSALGAPASDAHDQFLDGELVEERRYLPFHLVWCVAPLIVGALLAKLLPDLAKSIQKEVTTNLSNALGAASGTGILIPLKNWRKSKRRIRELEYLQSRIQEACKGAPPNPEECKALRDHVHGMALPNRPE